ncbi:efflux RND transporter periplasmic adaptor subunit [Alteriqipengyuania sp. WL0013]|nr:efflux RND transporter periplasmic adaptor subunit [Alteriqipengyuania sp. WL0013]MEB3416270.1 efflux RND transporter periplasmic adaptor subunit [Alteriqipengyuania sp. WL0013]
MGHEEMNYETGVEKDKWRPQHEIAADTESRVEIDTTDDADRRKRRRIIIIAVVIALLAAIAAYAMIKGGGAPADTGNAEEAPAVTVVAPGRTTIEGTLSATGTIAARRETSVGVVGEGGRVVSVNADAGDWVRQGQVLVSIDRSVQNQQAAAARAQIGVAQADLDLAQSNLERALKLVERGFISTADVDRLTATRDAARARVQVARAQLNELQARNARLNIYAPVSGLVLSRSVEPGQTVSAGTPSLFTIARGGEMEMLAQVGEAELARISTGTAATVKPVGTDREFSGQVWQIAPTIDQQNRQGTARIALSYNEGLKPGGFATATINSGTLVAPLLPESAVMSDDEGSYVFIIGEDNKIVRRAVETGLITQNGVAIASGLSGTERVVLRAGGFLNEGETVRPVAPRR